MTIASDTASKTAHIPNPVVRLGDGTVVENYFSTHDHIANHVTENTAAVIVEPVQGVGGAFDMGQEFLAALRQRCDDTGALLIFDEVQCGVGRSGTPFAANYYGVMPDMITTAKALGNGFPVSALLLTPPLTASLKMENLGTTFGGGPMACAVVEAVIEAIESFGPEGDVTRESTGTP